MIDFLGVELATCAHKDVKGRSNGESIEFKCVACGHVVKTVWQSSEGTIPSPHSFQWDVPKPKASVSLPSGWYVSSHDSQGDPILKDADGRLRCNQCHLKTSETYKGGLCSKCKSGTVKSCLHTQWTNSKGVRRCTGCGEVLKNVKTNLSAKPYLVQTTSVMKNGDIRKLSTANSPMWTKQWSVMGTAKMPYVVSHRGQGPYTPGSMTTTPNLVGSQHQGWACSCPNFTQHMPRTECKHILKVMMSEGVTPAGPPVASLPDDQQEAFQAFLRQQAERGTPALPAGKAKPLFTTGRKFR